MSGKWLIIPVVVWLPLASAADPPKNAAAKPNPHVANQAANEAARQEKKAQTQAAKEQARATQQALNAPKLPGGLTLDRLAQMSPEERSAALGNLPAARQQQIEKRLDAYRAMPPAAQARVQNQVQRLDALPPDKRASVRQSLAEFRNTEMPRRTVIARELAHLSTMTDAQRATYMSKPAFRGRFSESEIQMIDNLREIIP
jgi:hypothetical protein